MVTRVDTQTNVNGSATSGHLRTPLTQFRSPAVPLPLPDCARHLARLRPSHPAPHLISNLIGQLKSYEGNPDGLRPMILSSVERIEEAQR